MPHPFRSLRSLHERASDFRQTLLVSSHRVHIRFGDQWHEFDAKPIRANELKAALGVDSVRRLRLEKPGDPRLLHDDELVELHAGMTFFRCGVVALCPQPQA